MKSLFAAILFAYSVSALANSSVKPTKSNENKTHCNVNNNYNSFYAGPNCKKIEQQLAEIKKEILEEIRALKRNETGGSAGKGFVLTEFLRFWILAYQLFVLATLSFEKYSHVKNLSI